MREAILAAAEELFSVNGFNAASGRDVAQPAGANPGSVTYHFTTKDGVLLEICRRHCVPMNLRRSELLAAAERVRDPRDRLEAIVSRLSRDESNGAAAAEAIEQLVQVTVASLQAPPLDRPRAARPPGKIPATAGPLPH